MNRKLDRISRQYAAALRRFLVEEKEAGLEQAYELGRAAISGGLGVLDIARVHEGALLKLLSPQLEVRRCVDLLRSAELFFMETLSPFEATHRGFKEANTRLQQLNEMLAHRNAQLAATNTELESEIGERKRVERALRESEDHYRKLFQQARLMEENLRQLSNQVISAQEEERKRISRDLHDEVGQAVAAINMVLAMLKQQVANLTLQKRIADTQGLLEQALGNMHRFARELRPAMIDDLGIVPALRSYIKAFTERTGIKLVFNSHPSVEQLESGQKTVLFRVAQESLTNVAKHAQATKVKVSIRRFKDRVQMMIADNGKSFLMDQVAGKKRLGLLGMQERVRLVNGEFDVDSKEGRGTTIRVQIPVGRVSDPANQNN